MLEAFCRLTRPSGSARHGPPSAKEAQTAAMICSFCGASANSGRKPSRRFGGIMTRSKPARCLATVVLAATLLSTPSLAAADPEPVAAGATARQEGLWALLLAWLSEPTVALLDIKS